MILGCLFLANVLAWIGVWELSQTELEVTFFDVGQGDAIFIETPQNQQILIDGGPASIILEKLSTNSLLYPLPLKYFMHNKWCALILAVPMLRPT